MDFKTKFSLNEIVYTVGSGEIILCVVSEIDIQTSVTKDGSYDVSYGLNELEATSSREISCRMKFPVREEKIFKSVYDLTQYYDKNLTIQLNKFRDSKTKNSLWHRIFGNFKKEKSL
ncbi:MAG: hypothetical protein WC549_02060 [Actinomycetota bacterium]